MNGKAVQHGKKLKTHEGRLGRVYARHAETVLRRERRDHAHAESAHHGHGLQIGLYARASAGVGTGNGKNVRYLMHETLLFSSFSFLRCTQKPCPVKVQPLRNA